MEKQDIYPKVIVTDIVHPDLLEGLIQQGYQVDYRPTLPRDEVMKVIKEYFGIVINSRMYMDREAMDKAENLKFIARLGSGLEIIDLSYAAEKGISVFNSPEGNCTAVAEHVLGMVLSLFNNLPRTDQEVRAQIWQREKNRGRELTGLTVGVIGVGHTGGQLSQLLQGFEITLLGYDKYKRGFFQNMGKGEEVSLDVILRRSDLISLHVPLTEETHHMVDKAFLERTRPGVVIVNASRGSVVDTRALIEALENGKVGGACLDVFENEKPPTWTKQEKVLYQRLYDCDNVLLSPHVAGWTFESKEKLSKVLLDKISSAF